jgi:hypothetical protein
MKPEKLPNNIKRFIHVVAAGAMKNKWGILIQIAIIAALGHFIAYKICHIPKQIELVALLSIILFYPIIRFPKIGLHFFFFLSPFIPLIRRLYYLEHGRPETDPLIIAGDIIIFILFAGVFLTSGKNFPKDRAKKIYLSAIAFYFVYLVFRTFAFSISPLSENIGKLKYYAPAVLLFFIGVLFARDFSSIKRLWYMTVIIGAAAWLYGLKQLFLGYSISEKLWFSSIHFTTLFIKGIARPFSFFQSPAAFADYLLLGMIGIMMLVSWSSFRGKRFLLFLIPIYFYGILITSVRSNWIGAIISVGSWFIVFKIKSNGRRIALLAGAVLLVFLYQFIDDSIRADIGIKGINTLLTGKLGNQEYIDLMVTSRTGALTNPFQEYSMLSRLALWKYMFLLSSDPEMAILGRGLGTLNADSLYVTYLAEFGYPGFIFIIAILLAFLIRGIRIIDSSKDLQTAILAKGIVCMNLAFVLMNITGTHIHSFPGDAYFWFFNGVLIGLPTGDQPLPQSKLSI